MLSGASPVIKIVVDLGNTRAKIASFSNNETKEIRIFKTHSFRHIQKYLNTAPEKTYCIVSSVVDLPEGFINFLHSRFKTLMLNTDTPLPIKNLYHSPETLGKDRLAAAVSAWNIYPGKNLLVIDAGTAITMDLVTCNGEFIGGAISPGLDMRFKALHTFTGKLPLVKRKNINYLTGTTTIDSICSGVINGTVAEIDGIIDKYRCLYPGLITIFGGGDCKFLHKRLKNSIFALPNPVLNGLLIILDYNIENYKLT